MKASKNNLLSVLEQSNLSFKLTKLETNEILSLKYAPSDIYAYQNNLFRVVLNRGELITREKMTEFIQKNVWPLFIPTEAYILFKNEQQEELRNVTRSLSIGDAEANAKKQSNLLCQNMSFLYQSPAEDEVLKLQHQSTKNLCNFLLENNNLGKELFKEIQNSARYHFLIKQPYLSTLMLLGFLKNSNHFSPKEIESLFITSYFKDVGMSLIPKDKHDSRNLSDIDKQSFHNHPEHSAQILNGRIPISTNYLDIMLNHHQFYSMLESKQNNQDKDQNIDDSEALKHIAGAETLFVCIFDILAALITPRPYRKAMTLYEALELIRSIMIKDHANEFKHIVLFVRKYFT
ncbi:MAG: hypothetical protein U0T83_09650 [Bacteriovoracaceae bacterium]